MIGYVAAGVIAAFVLPPNPAALRICGLLGELGVLAPSFGSTTVSPSDAAA